MHVATYCIPTGAASQALSFVARFHHISFTSWNFRWTKPVKRLRRSRRPQRQSRAAELWNWEKGEATTIPRAYLNMFSHFRSQHTKFITNSKRIGVVLGTALNLATGKYMDSLLLGYKICLAIEVSPWFRYISFVWYYVSFHFADEESRWLIDYRWRCGKFSLMFYSQGFWLWHPSAAKQVQTRIETVLIWGDNTAKASCKSWFHHRACGCSERSDALTCEMPFRCFPDGMPARTMGTVGLCWGQCPVDCSQKLACN